MAAAERLLYRVQAAWAGEPLDRRDGMPLRLHGQHSAGLDRAPVEEHRAGTARRRLAADMRAGEVKPVAQHRHEQFAWLDLHLVGHSVDGQPDCHRRVRESVSHLAMMTYLGA